MIALVLLSLILTTFIAFIMSIGFYFIKPEYAIAVFWMTFAFEWIVMEPINRVLRMLSVKEEGKTFDKLARYEETVGKQAVSLECEYCGEPNVTKISLNEDNSFTCSKCDNVNKIIIQFSTIRVSNPLNISPQIETTMLEELDKDE